MVREDLRLQLYQSFKHRFMFVLSIKVPIRKKSGNLFNTPRTSIFNKIIHIFRSKYKLLNAFKNF